MDGRPRNPTILDVARVAGVSKSVVSRVFSGQGAVGDKTRSRVLDAASGLGYVVNASARAMSAHRTYTLGVFVREASNPFYGQLLTTMQQRAASQGYRVLAATGAGALDVAEERRALETLIQLQVEGVVICSGLLPVADVLAVSARVPTVIAGRPESHPDVHSVYCDEQEGAAALADHVASLGHRAAAVITYAPHESLTTAPRSAAMGEQLRRRGVVVHEVPGSRWHDTAALSPLLHEHPEVTAIMAPGDQYAVRVIERLAAEGIDVPSQMSVTGYDGIGPLATSLIGLTTWRQPLVVIAEQAVDTVLALLSGHQTVRHRSVSGTPVLGRTVSAPPG